MNPNIHPIYTTYTFRNFCRIGSLIRLKNYENHIWYEIWDSQKNPRNHPNYDFRDFSLKEP